MCRSTTLLANSRWLAFILTAGVFAVLSLAAAFALIRGTEVIGRQKLAYQALIDYQKQKLAGPIGDVVFIGDSSLGTAIDANLWRTLTGKAASNFALTGAYGYLGTRYMLEAILEHHSPTDIVIVQTAGMMMRAPKEFISPLSPNKSDLTSRVGKYWLDTMNVDELLASVDYLLKISRGKEPDIDDSYIENDFVRQVDRKAKLPKRGLFDPTSAKEANLLELNHIASICRERALTCVYVHGPLASPYCEQEEAYFARVNALIRSTALTLALDHPPCLSAEQLGNAFDHTKPSGKADMTRRFSEMLRPYLTR